MNSTLRHLARRGLFAAGAAIVAEAAQLVTKRVHADHQDAARVNEAEKWIASVKDRALEWADDAEMSRGVQKFCRRIVGRDDGPGEKEAKASRHRKRTRETAHRS